jgi:hypothetical protein
VGAYSGQRPTSLRYAHTSAALPVIVMRLSVLNPIRPCLRPEPLNGLQLVIALPAALVAGVTWESGE